MRDQVATHPANQWASEFVRSGIEGWLSEAKKAAPGKFNVGKVRQAALNDLFTSIIETACPAGNA